MPSFLLDENVPRSLGDALKRRGFAVRLTAEVLGAGAKNSDLVNVAAETGEIILSFDAVSSSSDQICEDEYVGRQPSTDGSPMSVR